MILPQSQMFIPTPLALIFLAWSLIWKGLALWRAARNQHKWWFVALLILNTAGLLEIGYLIFVDKQEVFKHCRAYWAKMKETEAKAPEAPKIGDKPVEKPVDKPENKI
jgi:methionyl-tRNA synthetase